jgi:eukaryotic-like serine/threonine-protein kinase
MSPEQVSGEKHIDQRADIWSLGIIMYRCLSGVLPTDGRSYAEVFRKVMLDKLAPLEQLAPEVPADVCALVQRMLARPRDDRPWDLQEVHLVLETYAGEHAPSFEAAVLPVWNEETGDASVTTGSASGPLVGLTPPGLQPDGGTPPGAAGGGTVVMNDPSRPSRAPLPPRSPLALTPGAISKAAVSPSTPIEAPPAAALAAPSPTPVTMGDTLTPAAASSNNAVMLVVAVLVALVAGVVLFMKLRGG